MGRIIGISWRVKETVDREARPTKVAVIKDKKIVEYDLSTEDDELDFANGLYVTKWRTVAENEDISVYKPNHCQWRRVPADQDVALLNEAHLRRVPAGNGTRIEICTEVPIEMDGLCAGDQIAMALGAGNMLAGLLFVKGKRIGAKIYRVPPMYLNEHRENPDKKYDHRNLLKLFEDHPEFFYEVRQPDKALIVVAEKLDAREEIQDQRIACGNRLIRSVIGRTFLSEEEEMVGLIKDRASALKETDVVYSTLDAEEERREKELIKAVNATSVWPIFEPVKGAGRRIVAGIIAPIGDIRRFMVPPDFTTPSTQKELDAYRKSNFEARGMWTLEQFVRARRRRKAQNKSIAKVMKFCGVHVLPDGRFPRRRAGEVANWSPAARQALWLLGDQFNRNPDSEWGKKLLQYKAGFRLKHPEPIVSSQKLAQLFRQLEVFFRTRAKVTIQPKDLKIENKAGLLAWFKDCCFKFFEKLRGQGHDLPENNFDVNSIDGLYAWFKACCTAMGDKSELLREEIDYWEEKIESAQNSDKTIKVFTAGHILKMAKWRTLTRFVRWMYKEWEKLEK